MASHNDNKDPNVQAEKDEEARLGDMPPVEPPDADADPRDADHDTNAHAPDIDQNLGAQPSDQGASKHDAKRDSGKRGEGKRDGKARETAAQATLRNEDGELMVIPPDLYRAREFARVQAEARRSTSKWTIPGGKFIVNGQLVNANGQRINDKGKVIE